LRRRHFLRWLIPLVALVAFVLAYPVWFGAMGSFLVSAGPPVKAEIIVVPAGDGHGNRILKAGELIREGYAPEALVSGPGGNYGFHECDLAIPFAVKYGFPKEWFTPFPNDTRSTYDEAQAIVPELRRRHIHRFLVVTSDYHTRRAGRTYRAVAPDLEMHVVAAPDYAFTAHGWWHTREGRKQFAFEWIKTVASWLGL
jgi:uncharacterized SAM-binding protein YcdF (DUF218 family)